MKLRDYLNKMIDACVDLNDQEKKKQLIKARTKIDYFTKLSISALKIILSEYEAIHKWINENDEIFNRLVNSKEIYILNSDIKTIVILGVHLEIRENNSYAILKIIPEITKSLNIAKEKYLNEKLNVV